MGQSIGTVKAFKPGVHPFVNLPRQDKIVEKFDLLAEGYDVTLEELKQILELSFKDRLGVDYDFTPLRGMVNQFFRVFDAQNRGVVDYFEVLSTLCLVSDMSLVDKGTFIFDLFDLEKNGLLSIEGVTLAVRCAVSGLCKIAEYEQSNPGQPQDVVSQEDRNDGEENETIETIIELAFNPNSKDLMEHIGKEDFLDNVKNLPVCSWLEHFSEIDDVSTDMNMQETHSTNIIE